jgi:hypothetical protein
MRTLRISQARRDENETTIKLGDDIRELEDVCDVTTRLLK